MLGDPRVFRIVAGLPFNRSFTLFEDVGQTDPLEIAAFRAVLTFKDLPGRFGTVTLRLNSDDNDTEVRFEAPNKLHVNLTTTTTAAVPNGIYELVIQNKTNPLYVIPIARSLVQTKKLATVL